MQLRPTCDEQWPREARGSFQWPLPKKNSHQPASPISPAGTELCVRKAWPGSAYNSHNAVPAGRGELQPPRGGAPRSAYSKRAAESRPGLASKQHPGAGGERASELRPTCPGPQHSGPAARAPQVPPTPAPSREHAPDPAAAQRPANAHTTGLPAPPRPEPRRGCIVAGPRASRGPQTPGRGAPRESEKRGRGRKPPGEGGGGSAVGRGGEATSTKHGRDCCRTTWVCLQFTNVATRPPAADKSDRGRSGPPRSEGGGSPDGTSPARGTAAAPAAKKG